MEDIASKLTEILNNPEIMRQIENLTQSSPVKDKAEVPKKEKSVSDIGSELGSLSPDIINTVKTLAPILSSMKDENKYTKFLCSLRPLLSEPRQKKLDESSKIVKLIQIFPVLKDSGVI